MAESNIYNTNINPNTQTANNSDPNAKLFQLLEQNNRELKTLNERIEKRNNQNNYASDILSIREAVDKLLQNTPYPPHLQPMQEEGEGGEEDEDEDLEVDIEGEDEDLEEEDDDEELKEDEEDEDDEDEELEEDEYLEEEEANNQYESIDLNGFNQRVTVTANGAYFLCLRRSSAEIIVNMDKDRPPKIYDRNMFIEQKKGATMLRFASRIFDAQFLM